MKNKEYKIKRHGSVYGKNRVSPLKIIGTVAVVVAVAIAGWNTYPILYSAIMKEDTIDANTSASSDDVSESQNSVESVSSSTIADRVEVSTPENVVEPDKVNIGAIKGAYLPSDVIANIEGLKDTLVRIKESGYNTVFFDAKDANGTVLFRTTNKVAIKSSAIAANAFDAAEIAKMIDDVGLNSMVKIHAFKDNIAATNKEMVVTYYDTEITWLDNSPEQGGRAWLNPYDIDAQKYVTDLCLELSSYGFKNIIVDSIQFPSGYGREKAGFGVASQKITKSQVLNAFIADITSQLKATNATIIPYFSSLAITGQDEFLYGGSWSNLEFGSVMVGIFPSFMDNTYQIGTEIIQSPKVDYANTVDVVSTFIKSSLKDNVKINLLLECSKEDGSTSTKEEVEAMVKNANNNGINACVLYSSSGKYTS